MKLDNQTDSSIVAGNNLNIKKSLDSIDNTKTNLITNAGTLHANNNQSIFANTLNNSGDITATNELNITATNITTTGANTKISANNTNITTNNLSITDTALLAVNNMILSISNLFTNRGTTQSNQALTLSAKTLDNQQYIIANNATLTTEDITNSGTIHAKNNLTIATNNLDNNNQISSDNTLSITSVNDIDNQNSKIIALGDITIKANNFNNQNAKLIAYGASNVDIEQNIDNTNGDISAKSMILDTDSIDVNNSKIYANKDLKIIIPHLNNTVGSNIGSGGDLTIDAKDYITNNAELTANGNFDLITQGDLTNNNLISSEGALTINADNLTNNKTISGGTGNSNINITGDVINHSRISSKENLNVTAQNITNNGFFNAAQDLTLTTSNNLTNNQTLFSGNDMKLYVANELNNTEDANIFAFNNLTIAKDADNNKTNKVINDKATIQTYQGDIDVYAKSLENKAKQAQIGTTDAVSSSITLYYGYYGASDVKTKWGKPIASLAYTDQAIALAKIKQIEKGNYYNIYTTNENICVNDGCTINGIFYDKSEINASSRVVKGDTIFDTYTVYSYSYKDRSNQADSLVKHTSYTTDAVIEELDKYYEKYGLNVASSHIPEERNDEYTIPAYTIYYFTDVPKHGIIQQATVNIKEDYLINQPEKKAQLSSGGNLNINVDKIDNYLSEISARNDINFNSNEVNNVGDRLYRYNKKTGQYYYCYHNCSSWIYSPDYTWADLPSSTSREVLRILPSTIQAGGSITGNINNLNNGNINSGVSVSTIPSQTQTTTTTANTQSIAQQNNNVNVQTVTTQTQTTNTQAVTNTAINTQTQTTNQKAVTKDEVNTQTQTTNTQAVTNTAINTQTQTTNQKAVTKDKVNTQTQTTDTQAVANNKVDTQTQTTNTQSTNPTIVTKPHYPSLYPLAPQVYSSNPKTHKQTTS
ncbi:MAG: hypothetical protein H0A76_04210 [Candidatus Thiodubiliella endoseptemdiera]|uniref:Uncharacterized protein n=1 Tax=Candidatus Thiodubiliella endoseptemdiera TaxID=2738886 RepID=A0A853F010_9GAMM|nr:hypothetical protein [Candidatus Thiodubiliella endoseptemdiera]